MSMTAPQNRSSVSRKTTTSGSVCPEVDRRLVSSVCDMKSMRYAGGEPNDLFGCFTQRRPSGTFRPSLEGGLLVHIQGCRTLALVSTLTRRQLLYRAGTAAAAALAAEGGIAAAARGAPTVLVIGGGLAGLSATRSLRDRGHDVRLFDASDRLGGRVWTLPARSAERRTPGWTRAPRVRPGSFGTEEGGVLSRRETASSATGAGGRSAYRGIRQRDWVRRPADEPAPRVARSAGLQLPDHHRRNGLGQHVVAHHAELRRLPR